MASQRTVSLLEQRFDFQKGVIIEGVFTAQAVGGADSYAGFYLGHQQKDQGAGILMGIGAPDTRLSYIGLLRDCADTTLFDPVDDISGPETLRRAGLGVANVTGITNNKSHRFRL